MAKFYLLPFTLCCLVGCGEFVEEESQEVPVVVELPAALGFAAQSEIGKIVLKITASDIATPITAELTQPIPATPAFSVSVPPGADRTFEVFATIAGDPTVGFHGAAVADITDTGGTVPLSVDFVNFAEDAKGTEDPTDVIDIGSSFPDIFLAKVLQGPCGAFPDAIIFRLDLEDSFFLVSTVDTLQTFIELDTDGNPATGAAQNKIDKVKGTLAANFSTGSERYLLVNVSFPGTVSFVQLFNSVTDTAIDSAGSQPFAATLTQPTRSGGGIDVGLEVCVTRDAFNTFIEIDGDGKGTFNLITGRLFGSFAPNDVAYREGVIRYDLGFDTSSL